MNLYFPPSKNYIKLNYFEEYISHKGKIQYTISLFHYLLHISISSLVISGPIHSAFTSICTGIHSFINSVICTFPQPVSQTKSETITTTTAHGNNHSTYATSISFPIISSSHHHIISSCLHTIIITNLSILSSIIYTKTLQKH